MKTFGLITEGITDQIVIENILFGVFKNTDIPVEPLSPLRDETDENRASTSSNWHEVFEYCRSQRFKQAVFNTDYVIIQVDTDVFMGDSVGKAYQIALKSGDGKDLSVKEIVENVIEKFKEIINSEGESDFYEKYQDKIIFAVSVHSIECWLLPLYHTQKAQKTKIVNCLGTLNKALSKKEGFSIDKKDPKYYRQIARNFWKNKKLHILKVYQSNPSLQIFVEDLLARNIVIGEGF